MTDREKETSFNIADLEAENRRLKKIEQAAQALVKSLNNSIDYNTWDAAFDVLEAALREKL
jgi:hypothetical protein